MFVVIKVMFLPIISLKEADNILSQNPTLATDGREMFENAPDNPTKGAPGLNLSTFYKFQKVLMKHTSPQKNYYHKSFYSHNRYHHEAFLQERNPRLCVDMS